MKKFYAIVAILLMVSETAMAVEVGDIYYHDKTFDNKVIADKMPIGLVYWVSARKDHGYIMALNQPSPMDYAAARTYCQNYQTLGTGIGDWSLPYRIELLRMGNERIDGVSNTKFTDLNNKLKTISIGQALVADYYYWALSSSPYRCYLNKFGLNTGSATNSFYVRCVTRF